MQQHTGEGSDARELSGRIVGVAGEPMAGAQVALSTDRVGAMVSHGRLKPIRDDVESRIVETDSSGDFNLGKPPDGGFDLIVAHDKGFALVTSEEFVDSREILLQSWGRIEGRLAEGRYAYENKIWMAGLPNPTWFLHKREYLYETACDAGGRFVFEKVPAGWFEAGYLTRTGDSGWSITSRTPVEVAAGQTTEMMLGGSGRPVIGKFVPPEGYDKPVYFGNGLRSLDRTRPDGPRPENYDRMTRREQAQWRTQWHKSEEFGRYRDAYWHDPNWRQYTFRINDDGTFRIEDVIAGKYDLTVWIEERLGRGGPPEEIGSYYGTVEVPQMPGGRSDTAYDLGQLELSMNEPPLRAGDAAPLFEAKTLDGKDIRLIDCRGKFVLLSFWQPVSHPERRRLHELYDAYDSGGRLVIIGLGGHDTLEEVRKYVQENDMPWPQIFTGEGFKSGIAKDYRLPGIPWIFLVGPDGKVIAKNLRGEELTSAVHRALGAPTEHKSDVKFEIEARIFSIKMANNSIADYLYSKLGIRNVNAEASLKMPVELTDEQADAFKKWVAAIPGASILVSPKATVVSGELIDQSLMTQHEFIVGYKKPEVSSETPEPVLEKFTTGVKLNITPELRRDGKVIVLKLAFSKRDLIQVSKDLDESGYEIERPVIDTVAVNASVFVVVGKNTLVPVAGLSSTGGIEIGEKPIQQTLLLIKPTILNLASGL